MSSNTSCIEVHDVSYYVAGHHILEHVSFSLQQGDYVGLIGPNGGGKTTLLKIILGLLKPGYGKVKVFGQPVARLKKRYQIGYVPQKVAHETAYFPATAEEVVRSGRTGQRGLFRFFSAADRQAVLDAMEIAGVTAYRHKTIGQLSGGERQRVFIARALASEPKILILDEPTVGVDIAHQEKFYAFLRRLNDERNMTILFVSHDVEVVMKEVDTILCLNQSLVCHDSPAEFLKHNTLAALYGKGLRSIHHGH